MVISPKARALIGVITTTFFAVSGVSFLLSERTTIGMVLILLALFRGGHALRQISRAMGLDREPSDGDP